MAEQLSLLDAIEQADGWVCPTCNKVVDDGDLYCCNIGALVDDIAEQHRVDNPSLLRYVEEASDSHEATVMGLPHTRRGKLVRFTKLTLKED